VLAFSAVRRWGWVLLAVLLLGAGFLFLRSRGEKPVVVDLERVTRRARFQSFVTASGEIVAARYADIGSSVMGKIVALRVAEGDAVKTGQVLARIDPAQAAATSSAFDSLARALEGDLAAARAREIETRQALARASALSAEGVAAQADLDTAQAAADGARAAVAAAERRLAQGRAQLAGAQDSLAKTEITATMDGVVTRLSAREGEMVVVGVQNQPGTILMTLSDLSQIDAEVKVAEADVLRLAVGQKSVVTLEALPGKELAGQVVEIGASALPVVGGGAAAREFRVVVRLDQPNAALRPGLTCDVRILAQEEENATVVPLQAVVLRKVGDAERSGVYVVQDGRARFTAVATGIIGGLDVAISGLAEGTEIVAGPFQALREMKDGAAVRARAPASK